jgi:hypothetical protein
MKPQNGFTVPEMLMILVLICLLAGTGWAVYKRQPSHSPQAASVQPPVTPVGQSTSPGGVPGGAGGSTSPSSQPPATVVALGSTGLQITVPTSLSDLTYSLSQTSQGTVISFSTKSLSSAIPACAANSGSGAFDTVVKGSGQYASQGSNGALIQQYPSYYVAYRLPTAPCAKNLSRSQQILLDDQAQTFYSALPSVRAQ